TGGSTVGGDWVAVDPAPGQPELQPDQREATRMSTAPGPKGRPSWPPRRERPTARRPRRPSPGQPAEVDDAVGPGVEATEPDQDRTTPNDRAGRLVEHDRPVTGRQPTRS